MAGDGGTNKRKLWLLDVLTLVSIPALPLLGASASSNVFIRYFNIWFPIPGSSSWFKELRIDLCAPVTMLFAALLILIAIWASCV